MCQSHKYGLTQKNQSLQQILGLILCTAWIFFLQPSSGPLGGSGSAPNESPSVTLSSSICFLQLTWTWKWPPPSTITPLCSLRWTLWGQHHRHRQLSSDNHKKGKLWFLLKNVINSLHQLRVYILTDNDMKLHVRWGLLSEHTFSPEEWRFLRADMQITHSPAIKPPLSVPQGWQRVETVKHWWPTITKHKPFFVSPHCSFTKQLRYKLKHSKERNIRKWITANNKWLLDLYWSRFSNLLLRVLRLCSWKLSCCHSCDWNRKSRKASHTALTVQIYCWGSTLSK